MAPVQGFGILTINGNSWGTAKEVIGRCHPNVRVILVQETKLGDSDRIDEQSAALMAMGWCSVWAPAISTDKGGWSGGLATLVRRCHGIRAPQVLVEGRGLQALVDINSSQTIKLINVYGYEGDGDVGQARGLTTDSG